MKTHNHLIPAMAIHPGEILLDELEECHMSQQALADRMERPYQVINAICRGRKGISVETVLDLEKVLEIPADFWLQLDLNYRLDTERIRRRDLPKAS